MSHDHQRGDVFFSASRIGTASKDRGHGYQGVPGDDSCPSSCYRMQLNAEGQPLLPASMDCCLSPRLCRVFPGLSTRHR